MMVQQPSTSQFGNLPGVPVNVKGSILSSPTAAEGNPAWAVLKNAFTFNSCRRDVKGQITLQISKWSKKKKKKKLFSRQCLPLYCWNYIQPC